MAAEWQSIFDLGQWEVRISYGDGVWYTPATLPPELGTVQFQGGSLVCTFNDEAPVGYFMGAPAVECIPAMGASHVGESARLVLSGISGLHAGDTYRNAQFYEVGGSRIVDFERESLPDAFTPNPAVIEELADWAGIGFTYVPLVPV